LPDAGRGVYGFFVPVRALALSAFFACSPGTPTQVIVDLDADATIRAATSHVAVTITQADGSSASRTVATRDMERWPLHFPIAPVGGDATRTFSFHAQTVGSGATSTVRYHGGFVEDRLVHVSLRFTADCAGNACDPLTTCEAGVCVSACSDETRTPPVCVQSIDAGPALDGGRDGGDDAGSDAGFDAFRPDIGICTVNADCGAVIESPFGPCEGFVEPCGESGTRRRTITTPRCESGTCFYDMTTHSESCSRPTEGSSCQADAFSAWGACGGFADECAADGIETRTRTSYQCRRGACEISAVEGESRPCSRATNGRPCGASGTYCGARSDCNVCRDEVCVPNTPHYDLSCNPSCGSSAGLCGAFTICCGETDACPSGRAGSGPWADCANCCIDSCD
jgi:hypothetical protein